MNINSTSCEVYKMFYMGENKNLQELKNEAINCYRNTDDSLYIGSKWIASLAWGMGYAVCIELGAIYDFNILPFSKKYFGLTEQEFITIKEQKEQEQTKRHDELEKQWNEEQSKREENKLKLLEELKKLNYPIAKDIKAGYYINVSSYNNCYKIYKINIDKFKRVIYHKKECDTIEDIKKFIPDSYDHGKVIDSKLIINKFYYMGI
jgi:hypothetical protein